MQYNEKFSFLHQIDLLLCYLYVGTIIIHNCVSEYYRIGKILFAKHVSYLTVVLLYTRILCQSYLGIVCNLCRQSV